MNNCIYKVIELNVNGGGENAEEYIYSSQYLFDKEKIFVNILKEVRANHSSEDWDTSDFVLEACREFNDRFEGYNLRPYGIIFEGVIEF